jgi:FkbM family methyltransferase
VIRLVGRAVNDLASVLARNPALARLLLPLPKLVPVRSLRYRPYRSFSWPLCEGLREQLTARTVAGKLLVDPRAPLGRVLAVSGRWEPHVTAQFCASLGPGDVCVDVGAHIGYYTLLASRRVGASGHVYAVEASPRVFRVLSWNLRRNAQTNVSAFHAAAGASSGSGVLYEAPGPNASTSSMSPRMLEAPHGAPADEFAPTVVRIVALDDLVPVDAHHRVRVVKVDVEGYEVEVLSGMRSLLRAGGDISVFVELSPEWASEDPASFLERFCVEHALTPLRITNDFSLEGFFPGRVEPPEPLERIPSERCDLVLVRRRGGNDVALGR